MTASNANDGAKASMKGGNQRLSVERLQKWEAMEYGILLHFGMATFTGYPPSHYRPPDFIQDPPSLYEPDRLDVDQWTAVVRDAGAKYAILIPIHLDGAIKDAGRRWTLSSIQSHAASERTRSGSDSNSLR